MFQGFGIEERQVWDLINGSGVKRKQEKEFETSTVRFSLSHLMRAKLHMESPEPTTTQFLSKFLPLNVL